MKHNSPQKHLILVPLIIAVFVVALRPMWLVFGLVGGHWTEIFEDSIAREVLTGVGGVALWEGLKGIRSWFRDSKPRRQAKCFFGIDHVERSKAAGAHHECSIYLQSDDIVNLFSGSDRGQYSVLEVAVAGPAGSAQRMTFKELIESRGKARLFKARNWINSFDADGARAISREIRNRTGDFPEMVALPRLQRDSMQRGGMAVYMGLGFTDFTIEYINGVCEHWAAVSVEDDVGDCLVLAPGISEVAGRGNPSTGCLKFETRDNGWERVVPGPIKDGHPNDSGHDYAIILRHTELQSDTTKVVFVCAGYTELGTYQAGRHLAANWRNYLKIAGTKGNEGRGHGDFLAIIGGNSTREPIWGPAELIVTPQSLDAWYTRTNAGNSSQGQVPPMPSWVKRWRRLGNE